MIPSAGARTWSADFSGRGESVSVHECSSMVRATSNSEGKKGRTANMYDLAVLFPNCKLHYGVFWGKGLCFYCFSIIRIWQRAPGSSYRIVQAWVCGHLVRRWSDWGVHESLVSGCVRKSKAYKVKQSRH